MEQKQDSRTPVRVLFVCSGNICRSPTAEGILRKLAAERNLDDAIVADSAGTGDWNLGKMPDLRAQAVAGRHGIDISHLRSRLVVLDDFERNDYMVAMDRENFIRIHQVCPPGRRKIIRRHLSFAPEVGLADVPDPYVGRTHTFEEVFDIIHAGVRGLLDEIERNNLAWRD